VRGVGQVAVSRVELTNGVVRCRPSGWPPGRKKTLGRPVVPWGFCELNWMANRSQVPLPFTQARRSLIEPGRHG
jgi:hypothetical protein